MEAIFQRGRIALQNIPFGILEDVTTGVLVAI